MRRMPSAPPNKPASKTTLSRGEACPAAASGDAPFVVQSSWAKTNAAKSTSLGELDEPVEGRHTRVEHRRPRLDLGDVLEPPRERLEQLLLLAG